MHIILSRTDSIGDVVLTLPLAGIIKQKHPTAIVSFIGRSYTEPVVKLSKNIDRFVNWDQLGKLSFAEQKESLRSLGAEWIIHVFPNKQIARAAMSAGILNRVGTSHRIFHWFTCNRKVHFSRKKSDLHEAQLNCMLLKPLDVPVPSWDTLWKSGNFSVSSTIPKKISDLIQPGKKNIVLHPTSKGSAREWGLDNFSKLIQILPQNKYKIFITGTKEDAEKIGDFLKTNKKQVTDLTGLFNLSDFIRFLSLIDGIVAASTGPLHIAAALGKLAVGIYPPIRPMHPGRWAPIGPNVRILVKNADCEDCRKNMQCKCITEISPVTVKEILDDFQISG